MEKNTLELSKVLFPCSERQDGRKDDQPDRTDSFGLSSEENTERGSSLEEGKATRERHKEQKEG